MVKVALFPTPGLAVMSLWIGCFVVFTTLELKFNKTSFLIQGLPLVSVTDVIDLVVPVVIVPLYWKLWFSSRTKISFSSTLPLIVSSCLFIHGHGLHLASNSLSNLCHHTENGLRSVCSDKTSQFSLYVAALDWYDELVSHWLWISGICGFCSCLLWAQWSSFFYRHPALTNDAKKNTSSSNSPRRVSSSSGSSTSSSSGSSSSPFFVSFFRFIFVFVFACVYGVLFWAHNIEGATVPLGMPFCAAVIFVVWITSSGRRLARVSPLVLMFGLSHVITLALLVGWGLHFKGFPEFSHLPKNFISGFYASAA